MDLKHGSKYAEPAQGGSATEVVWDQQGPRLASENHVPTHSPLLFFFTLVTGPRRFLTLKLSDIRVSEPQIRARIKYGAVHDHVHTQRRALDGESFSGGPTEADCTGFEGGA